MGYGKLSGRGATIFWDKAVISIIHFGAGISYWVYFNVNIYFVSDKDFFRVGWS